MLYLLLFFVCHNLLAMEVVEEFAKIDKTALWLAQEKNATKPIIDIDHAKKIEQALGLIKLEKLNLYRYFDEFENEIDELFKLQLKVNKNSIDAHTLSKVNKNLTATVIVQDKLGSAVALIPAWVNLAYAIKEYNKINGIRALHTDEWDGSRIELQIVSSDRWKFIIEHAQTHMNVGQDEKYTIWYNPRDNKIIELSDEQGDDDDKLLGNAWSCVIL